MRYVQFTESTESPGSGRKTGNGTRLVEARGYMNRRLSCSPGVEKVETQILLPQNTTKCRLLRPIQC